MAEEDIAKIAFITEWGAFAYTIMSFGLNVQIYGLLDIGEKLHAVLSNLSLDPHLSQDDPVLGTMFSEQAGEDLYSSKGQIFLALAEDARTTYRQYCASLKQEIVKQTGEIFGTKRSVEFESNREGFK